VGVAPMVQKDRLPYSPPSLGITIYTHLHTTMSDANDAGIIITTAR